MNLLILLPFLLLIIPFIPSIIEIFKKKDKGPREVPEQTIYEEPPELEISRLERARGDARAKVTGDIIRITGNVSIPDETEIRNHLMVQGNLKIGKKTHIYGSIKAFGDIDIDESSVIDGHVLSEGEVTIGCNCVVKGIVDSLKDIILKENAVVEAVSTEKTVKIGPNAKINRRILSGASIVTFPQEIKEGESVKLEEAVKLEEVKPLKPEIKEELPEVSAEPSLKPLPPPPVEEKPVVRGGEIPFEVLDSEVGHLYLYAPTRYGKTYLIRNYVIPRLIGKKKIVVIDGHREYPFEPYIVNYDKTIPNIENDLFKTFITFNIWGDLEGIIKGMINHVAQSKGHVSIRSNIVDSNVEKLIISEFLKRMTQVKWKTPILLIIEDADKYDVLSTVTRGRHANIQVILTSAKKLMPEVFSNAHLVLGSINPSLIREYDSYAAEAAATLGRHEFIWEKDYHDWRRFRLGQESTRQIPSAPRRIEERRPIEVTQPIQISEPKPSLPRVIMTKPEITAKPVRMMDRIFEHLENRIKMFERSKGFPAESVDLEGLTPIEAKVFEAAHKCRSPEEICLRFLMDPTEVDEAINSLIENGYLDKNLNPTVPSKERQKEEEFSEKALIEKLIASKMREELKKKLEKAPSVAVEEKAYGNKINILRKASQEGLSNILKEWKNVSSLLWRKEESKTAKNQSTSKNSVKTDKSQPDKIDGNKEREEKTKEKPKERTEKTSGGEING